MKVKKTIVLILIFLLVSLMIFANPPIRYNKYNNCNEIGKSKVMSYRKYCIKNNIPKSKTYRYFRIKTIQHRFYYTITPKFVK